MRGDFEAGRSRNYDSSRIPINTEAPEVGLITRSGASLLVSNIKTKDTSPMQAVIIHGRTFFLAWLSGIPTRLDRTPLSTEFDLCISRGDPM